MTKKQEPHKYRCLGCGRDTFDRPNQPHTCNGQFRKHGLTFEPVEPQLKESCFDEDMQLWKPQPEHCNMCGGAGQIDSNSHWDAKRVICPKCKGIGKTKPTEMPTVSKDPIMEAIACKLSGINGVPLDEQERMIKRAVKAGAEAIKEGTTPPIEANLSMHQALEDIHDIAIGYDGFGTVKSLKKLIDELRELAKKGLMGKYHIEIFKDTPKILEQLRKEALVGATQKPSPCLKYEDHINIAYEKERESHGKPIKMEISSKVPSKWRFVDLETGDIWKWDEARGTFISATLG